MDEMLMTISEAARMLGVSEVALRQWTNEGRVKAFITPGGHRRYSKTELKNFMNSQQHISGVKDLIAEIEATGKLHVEISRTSLVTKEWYSRLDKEKAGRLACLGRNMLNIIVQHINEPSKTEQHTGTAREIGQGFGEILAKLGLPLTDAVEAFILHRDPMMKAVTHLRGKKEAQSGIIVEAIPAINSIMDAALLSLIEAHQQQYSTVIKKGSRLL